MPKTSKTKLREGSAPNAAAGGAGAGANKANLKSYIEQIKTISDWFEDQQEIDLEEALIKIREAGDLIKLSKDRLVEVENEFKEIKAGIEEE